MEAHGGRIVAKVLRSRGVDHLFTLSGGHLFSIYDGCKEEGIGILDVRHEQTAVFAAEGLAKATRRLGVAALTAGPGVTNGTSAIAGAQANNSPIGVLGGRAPEMRWGSGSLQEIDHLPFVSPLVKSARTVKAPGEIAALTAAALDLAVAAPSGPTFLDYPLDVVFSEAEVAIPDPAATPAAAPATGVEEAAKLLAAAERPSIMAGSGLYWGHGEGELRALAEALGIPVFLNGLGRGCLPADHELAFSRARGTGLKGADVALVVGVPMDFRLGFGDSFGEETKIVRLDVAANALTANRMPEVDLVGDVRASLAAIREGAGAGEPRSGRWLQELRRVEVEKRAAEQDELNDPRLPLHPVRIYRELAEVLDRDAIVVGDGGDFVSYAGRFIDTYEPGCWMDPGPFGCLGAGPGQAIGAKVVHPDRQVCLLLGDGAFGFAGMEFDTMARHGLGVVGVMGNNGIWALEHHPMKFLYGYSVAAELRPETRYDELVESLGCDGVLVRDPKQLRPALERAFESGRPTLVNVLTDPEVVYPRKSNLA
ncbi:MAG: thiamine pyrophosphate protein binding domain protein [Solirubrobacterales bacterium]|nr:thiamine pyrophosphate protein binding domain protein [Solirubrobacterales bacterium]